MKTQDYIEITGARVHNLKNVSVRIPRGKFVVITGLSGSGKSTLAFDTLFAEGQRRYVESLSAYARQFLGRISKPDVDSITGIPPAIAIEQKVNTRNPRSTVGTSTEVYDYIKLLFARIGRVYSPISGVEVRAHIPDDVAQYAASLPKDQQLLVLAPLILQPGEGLVEKLMSLMQNGFARIAYSEKNALTVDTIENFLKQKNGNAAAQNISSNIYVVAGRISAGYTDEETTSGYVDAAQTAFVEGGGKLIVANYPASLDEHGEPQGKHFSNAFEADGMQFEVLTEHLFSFNNPYGACPKCQGHGKVTGIDEELLIPNQTLSIYDDAVLVWKGESMKRHKEAFMAMAADLGFPIHRPYKDLTKEEKNILWKGKGNWKGIFAFFETLEQERYKIQNRVMVARYTGKCTCPDCGGSRLRKEALYVKLNGYTIQDITEMAVYKAVAFFNTIKLDKYESKIAARALVEIKSRLSFLQNVGLGYLSLGRMSNTLSGGESQRINLATSLGSSLVGSLYILDEPSIGLHPRDTQQLIGVLKALRDVGNTVVVVEHDEEIMRAADQIIDMGPLAGTQGGEVVFQGTIEDVKKN